MNSRRRQNLLKDLKEWLKIVLSVSGFPIDHITKRKAAIMTIAIAATVFFSRRFSRNPLFSFIYAAFTTAVYMAFIYAVLSDKGFRLWFRKKFGVRKGFLVYQTILGSIFFFQGASIGYISSATTGTIKLSGGGRNFFRTIGAALFAIGFAIKIWAAKVASADAYYWRDMFSGRRVRKFVVEGPYKFSRNPMYGLGHLQAYGVALWWRSLHGLLFALLNQFLIFSFYFLKEKKFIERVFKPKETGHSVEKVKRKTIAVK